MSGPPSALCNTTNLIPGLDWCLRRREINFVVICYNKTITHNRGLFQVESSLTSSLPIFILQLVCILTMNRLLMLAFRPLGLPRISAEILVNFLILITLFSFLFDSSFIINNFLILGRLDVRNIYYSHCICAFGLGLKLAQFLNIRST